MHLFCQIFQKHSIWLNSQMESDMCSTIVEVASELRVIASNWRISVALSLLPKLHFVFAAYWSRYWSWKYSRPQVSTLTRIPCMIRSQKQLLMTTIIADYCLCSDQSDCSSTWLLHTNFGAMLTRNTGSHTHIQILNFPYPRNPNHGSPQITWDAPLVKGMSSSLHINPAAPRCLHHAKFPHPWS